MDLLDPKISINRFYNIDSNSDEIFTVEHTTLIPMLNINYIINNVIPKRMDVTGGLNVWMLPEV